MRSIVGSKWIRHAIEKGCKTIASAERCGALENLDKTQHFPLPPTPPEDPRPTHLGSGSLARLTFIIHTLRLCLHLQLHLHAHPELQLHLTSYSGFNAHTPLGGGFTQLYLNTPSFSPVETWPYQPQESMGMGDSRPWRPLPPGTRPSVCSS